MSHGVADSAELTILTKAVEDYCEKHDVADRDDREQVAVKVMCLFRQGVIDPGQLKAELERVG